MRTGISHLRTKRMAYSNRPLAQSKKNGIEKAMQRVRLKIRRNVR